MVTVGVIQDEYNDNMDTFSISREEKLISSRPPDYSTVNTRIKSIHPFAMVTQTTDLVIDHIEKRAWLFHYNPGCSGIFGGMGCRQVGDNYLDMLVVPEDAGLFSRFRQAIRDCIRNDFLKGDNYYYFSFTIRLKGNQPGARMFSLKVIPFLFTDAGDPWVTIYYMEPSTRRNPETLVLHAVEQEAFFHFDEERNRFNPRPEVSNLSEVEKKILKFSAEGFTEKEIADLLGIPVSLLKNCKMKMFTRLSVKSVSAAISLAWKKGMI